MSEAILPGSLDDKLAYLLAHASLGRRLLPTAWIVDGHCSCLSRVREMDIDDKICAQGNKPGKHPIISDWANRASSDEETIIEWFRWQPQANWAWLQDQTFAVDVDPKRNGLESLTQWEEHGEDGGPPTTLTARTQSGGWHFIYRQPDEHKIPNVSDFLPGIETRGVGGYIIIQPSTGLDGAWTFIDHNIVPAEATLELLELISRGWVLDATFDETTGRRKATGRKSDLPETDWFLQNGFGSHTGSRNQDAYRLAWRLLAYADRLPEMYTNEYIASIFRAVWYATPQVDAPFTWDECLGCLQSAWKRRERQKQEDNNKLTTQMMALLGGEV